MKKQIEVAWPDVPYTDIFPLDVFRYGKSGSEFLHRVRGPQNGAHYARYRLTMTGNRAVADYRPFWKFNDRHGMENGFLEFRFPDKGLSQAPSATWKGKLAAKSVSLTDLEPGTLGEEIANHQRMLAKRQLARPKQAEFRKALDLVYGARCCISDCPVPWALEAAHIDEYKASNDNSSQNGLLLRSDIHSLFDSNLLAINPDSRLVYLAPEARAYSEYARWHHASLAKPQPGHLASAPTSSILKPRWSKFVAAHRKWK